MDQRYLDMIPVIDEGATIIRHQGCNVGSWNIETYKRVPQPDGSVLINDRYPIIFIHFNHETIQHIVNGDDGNLKPYYNQYHKVFSSSGKVLEEFVKKLDDWKRTGFYLEVKRKLSLRTRIKQSLFNLAKKL